MIVVLIILAVGLLGILYLSRSRRCPNCNAVQPEELPVSRYCRCSSCGHRWEERT